MIDAIKGEDSFILLHHHYSATSFFFPQTLVVVMKMFNIWLLPDHRSVRYVQASHFHLQFKAQFKHSSTTVCKQEMQLLIFARMLSIYLWIVYCYNNNDVRVRIYLHFLYFYHPHMHWIAFFRFYFYLFRSVVNNNSTWPT